MKPCLLLARGEASPSWHLAWRLPSTVMADHCRTGPPTRGLLLLQVPGQIFFLTRVSTNTSFFRKVSELPPSSQPELLSFSFVLLQQWPYSDGSVATWLPSNLPQDKETPGKKKRELIYLRVSPGITNALHRGSTVSVCRIRRKLLGWHLLTGLGAETETDLWGVT